MTQTCPKCGKKRGRNILSKKTGFRKILKNADPDFYYVVVVEGGRRVRVFQRERERERERERD